MSGKELPDPTTTHTAPAGYKPVEVQLPQVVSYTAVAGGREMRYYGRKAVRGKDKKDYTLHLFGPAEPTSKVRVGMWGCAALDVRLAEAEPGSKVYLKYNGKGANEKGREVHQFLVAVQETSPQLPREMDMMDGQDKGDDLPF